MYDGYSVGLKSSLAVRPPHVMPEVRVQFPVGKHIKHLTSNYPCPTVGESLRAPDRGAARSGRRLVTGVSFLDSLVSFLSGSVRQRLGHPGRRYSPRRDNRLTSFTEYTVCALPSVSKHDTAGQKDRDQPESHWQPCG